MMHADLKNYQCPMKELGLFPSGKPKYIQIGEIAPKNELNNLKKFVKSTHSLISQKSEIV